MATRLDKPCHIQNGESPQCKLFNNSVVSAAPGVTKPSSPFTKQNVGFIDSAKHATPVFNKLLNIGNADQSITSDSSSHGSPLTLSAQKKLRDLPHTTTLCGCVAYVDVWSSDATDNRSCVFRNFLTRMGATVVRKFTKEQPVTHVVFKDGHKSVIQKAQKRNIKIVNCLWVDRCRVLQKWVDEKDFLFDVSKYKPPKRFFEMQPQEPEEAIRRSAERLKRRKARYEKKHARIMFQSPLVTNSQSANNTPKDGSTPSNPAIIRKFGILAADTPYHPPSPYRYLNPSIVYETPVSDSMQRMMQRMKEGKHIFSPPSSDYEDDKDNSEKENVPDMKSPHKPKKSAFSIIHPNTPEPEREKFSPIADTQCFVKRSWRESGIPPPKFNGSCDEIPETQQLQAPDTPDQDLGKIFHPALPGGINEIPETQHMNISVESSPVKSHLYGIEQVKTLSQDNRELSNERTLAEISITRNEEIKIAMSQESAELNLHVSGESIESIQEESFRTNVSSKLTSKESKDKDCTPTEQKIITKPFVTSRRKKRKLLEDPECLEPVSILLSPQESTLRSKLSNHSTRVSRSRTSMLLPQLGFSAYKTVTASGRFFDKIHPSTPSECSMTSKNSAVDRAKYNSQSTDFDDSDDVGPNSAETDDKHHYSLDSTNAMPSVNELSLYDRIKMREKRNSNCVDQVEPSRKRRRRVSESSHNSTSRSSEAKNKISKTQPDKSLFCSQAATAICESLKKRRSTMDFTTSMQRSSTRLSLTSTKKLNNKKSVIVLTNFHSGERFDIHKAVRTLPGFRITSTVRDQTTHVVCGAPRRTMNVLRAIARGVWLLSKNWVTDSISAGFWLDEESYEITTIFPAAQRNRKCRSRNSLWENNIFTKYDGYIYIADDTKPSQEDLRELISTCGGSIVGSARRASICVGNPGRVIPDIPLVNETWVLDCVSENSLQPYEKYLMAP